MPIAVPILKGMRELIAKLDNMGEVYKKQAHIAKVRLAKLIETSAKKSIMAGNKSGREYARGKNIHIASAPGEAPANDSGELVSGITTVQEGDDLVYVISRAPHSKAMEFGTHPGKGKRFIAPRPFMQPAVDENRAEGIRIFKETLKYKGK